MDRKYTFSSYMITSAFKRNDKIGLSIGLNSDLCDTFRHPTGSTGIPFSLKGYK